MNNIGFRDRIDSGSGLTKVIPTNRDFTSLEHTIIVDSRDCIGDKSLQDTKTYAESIGIRGLLSGKVVNITNTYPPVLTLEYTLEAPKDGDTIILQGVFGCPNMNGPQIINNVLIINATTFTCTSSNSPNGNYTGNGLWTKLPDRGFPTGNFPNRIVGNEMIINLNKNVKNIRSISLFHIVIPRDIIPLPVYLADFVPVSTNLKNVTYTSVSTNYTTFIPQEKLFMESQLLGFYSSPLELYRSYTGNLSIPDQVTPPPLNLWNPPLGPWPLQPVSYPFQTVPTYKSDTFSVDSKNYHIILAGYGVYDLVDWTYRLDADQSINHMFTGIMRRLLLLLIIPRQSYNGFDYIDLILNCAVTDAYVAGSETRAFGFGNFQRYVPGPGIGQNYQPNTNTWYTNGGLGSGPPNTAQLDSPVPFPLFNGNVWGPYDAPGDRFQKLGLKTTIQDLFLNGDLKNLNGLPIILPTVPTEDFASDALFGLNFASLNEVNLANIGDAPNINIINAMRISPNGFGAATIRATGSGATYTNVYESAGGQGPSILPVPSRWVNNGVYGGAGTLTDPIAQGPLATGTTPATSNPTTNPIPNRVSYFDSGPNNGSFISGILKYINYVVGEIPDTDLIIKVGESLQDERVQSTNSFNENAMLDCPIRLNLGSTSGTIQYIESLQSLIAVGSTYWENRYFNAKAELSTLHIKFYSYNGTPIPLEKMLQLRSSSELLELFVRVIDGFNLNIENTTFYNFLFDPLNPELYGRVKRYMQIIFKLHSYEGTPPGNIPMIF